MYDLAIIWDWLGFAVRWLHVITAIAWIGSSFYFIALDLGLRKAPHLPVGAHGEEEEFIEICAVLGYGRTPGGGLPVPLRSHHHEQWVHQQDQACYHGRHSHKQVPHHC